jgi:hypothetical protein
MTSKKSSLHNSFFMLCLYLGEPLRAQKKHAKGVFFLWLASGYSRFASLIPARFALGTARKARRRYYPSRFRAVALSHHGATRCDSARVAGIAAFGGSGSKSQVFFFVIRAYLIRETRSADTRTAKPCVCERDSSGGAQARRTKPTRSGGAGMSEANRG